MHFDEQTICLENCDVKWYGSFHSTFFGSKIEISHFNLGLKSYFLVIDFKRIAISSRRLLNTSIGFGFARIIAV